MKWPAGKYNGKKIDGAKLSIAVHVLRWYWKPIYSANFGEPYLIWGCVTIRAYAEYV